MILVDTSVWISHLKNGLPLLKELLLEEAVVTHPFVIGEIACGRLGNRDEVISLLQALPKALTAEDDEILGFLKENSLHGVGLGLVDVHLLASSLLSQTFLWTEDGKLKREAAKLGIKYK